MAEKKVYEYNPQKVNGQLIQALRKRRNESTVADLVADTGLPNYQVSQCLPAIVDEYAGQMKVTESGEILYYFPKGMVSTVKGFGARMRKFFAGFFNITGLVLSFLFKVWIMVMLVGYFVLFLLLLVVAVVASIALSFARSSNDSSSSSRDGDSGIGFYLVIRLFELCINLWLYSGHDKQNRDKGRALHKSVFAFVFGEKDPNRDYETQEKKAFINFVQKHKGVVTQEEVMAFTGRDNESVNTFLNRTMVEFEGEPDVTENGTLIYRYPKLMVKTKESQTINLNKKRLIPFTWNKPGMNGWIGFFNGFNLIFAGYFFYYSFFAGPGALDSWASLLYQVSLLLFQKVNLGNQMWMILGGVPLVFSFLFYGIPIIRNILRSGKNEEVKASNFRREIYASVLGSPLSLDPETIQPSYPEDSPKQAESIKDRELKHFSDQIDVEEKSPGKFVYKYPEVNRRLIDISNYRNSVDLTKFDLGKTVFDSGQ